MLSLIFSSHSPPHSCCKTHICMSTINIQYTVSGGSMLLLFNVTAKLWCGWFSQRQRRCEVVDWQTTVCRSIAFGHQHSLLVIPLHDTHTDTGRINIYKTTPLNILLVNLLLLVVISWHSHICMWLKLPSRHDSHRTGPD